MRNITAESPPARILKTDISTMPPRGVDGCVCQQKAPRDQFIELADANNIVQWYARKSCLIHGITVTEADPTAAPATDTDSEFSTILS